MSTPNILMASGQRFRLWSRGLLTVALLAGLPRMTAAQSAPAEDIPTHAISVNPFLLLWGFISAEAEQRLNSDFSVAAAGSYIKFDKDRYSNIDAKFRFYPNEKGLQGFGLAFSVGATRIRYQESLLCDVMPPGQGCATQAKTVSSPSTAVELTYQWVLGAKRHTLITVGGGIKRFLKSTSELGGTSTAIPTGRLTIGYMW
jgi:hypothetical protein